MNSTWNKNKMLNTPDITNNWFCSLPGFSLLSVSGKDTLSFLNNQLSNDLAKVSENQGQLNVYCNPKGRAYCCFLVFAHGQHYYLRTTAAIMDTVIKRLQMYILRAEVQLHRSELKGIGIGGPNAGEIVAEHFGQTPDQTGAVIHHQSTTVIRAFGNYERYEIYTPPEQLSSWLEKLEHSAQAGDEWLWRRYDILSGIPNLYPETSEHFVPQMLNLDILGGLSFSKGCYPGQEVVSRTHYLGNLKRRMYRFSTAQTHVAPGTPIFVPAYSKDQANGEVIDACPDNDNITQGLAVLRRQGLETETIYLGTDKTASLTLEELPYKVPVKSVDPEKELPL